MHIHCCYGLCKSDSRRKEAGVRFLPFPKPNRYPDIARRWVQLCGRANFSVNKINRNTYICSKHFPVGELDAWSNIQTGKYKAWWKLYKGPILEPFDARKKRVKGRKEKLEAQNKEDPISVRLEYKQEQEAVTEGEEVEDPLLMIKSLVYQRNDNIRPEDGEEDSANSNVAKERSKMFECNDCDYNFTTKKSFDDHLWRAPKNGKCLKCEHCDFVSLNKHQLNAHMRVEHENIGLIKCEDCEYRTHAKSKMRIHLREAHGKWEQYQCEDCEYKTNNTNDMNLHWRQIHGKYPSPTSLQSHTMSIPDLPSSKTDTGSVEESPNNVEQSEPSQAQIDRKIPSLEPSEKDAEMGRDGNQEHPPDSHDIHLKGVVRSHPLTYPSTSKHKRRFRTYARKVHEKLFECGDCAFKCSKKMSFDVHIWEAHQKGNCLRCEYCEYATPNLHQFNNHMRIEHGKGEEFRCDDCDYKTYNINNIRVHTRRIHDKEYALSPRKCEIKFNKEKPSFPEADESEPDTGHFRTQENLSDEDTDTASETESQYNKFDAEENPSPWENENQISPRKAWENMKRRLVEEGVDPTTQYYSVSDTKYDYHEVQKYLGLSPSLPTHNEKASKYPGQVAQPELLFPNPAQSLISEIFDELKGPPEPSEIETPICQDSVEHLSKIDVAPVTSPSKIYHPKLAKFAEEFDFIRQKTKSQGVQVDVRSNDVILLQAQVKALLKENMTLKNAAKRRWGVKITNTIVKGLPSDHVSDSPEKGPTEEPEEPEGENEFSWSKKLKFYTKLTPDQCSKLYDSLDSKARGVLLCVVSAPNP